MEQLRVMNYNKSPILIRCNSFLAVFLFRFCFGFCFVAVVVVVVAV